MEPALRFYRGRIPRYSRTNSFSRLVTIIGSLAGAVMAVTPYATFVGVLSALTSAVIAWTEFSGTQKKLDRYSDIVLSLKLVQLWWDSLPEVERLATKSVDFLVSTVEKQMRTERNGWRATSQSMKKIQEALNSMSQQAEKNGLGGSSKHEDESHSMQGPSGDAAV